MRSCEDSWEFVIPLSMWLLPLRLSLSVPESVDSILPARESSVFGLWVTSSGTPMLRPFSWRGWKTRPWSQRLFGAALSNTWMPAYMRGWILSRQAFPASPSPSPVLDEARATTAGSGPQSPGSFAWYDRASSSWRTSLPLFGMDLIPSSQIWPNSGSMRNGICFERPRRERLTGENDSSSSEFPTPAAQSYGTNQGGAAGRVGPIRPGLEAIAKEWGTPTSHERTQTPRDVDHGEQLANQAAMWGTPRVTTNNMAGNPERKGGHHSRIEDQAAMWPTPRAADFEATGPHRGTPDTLPSAVDSFGRPDQETPKDGSDGSKRAVLNPQFVETLMGLPIGWTDCDAWAMRWSPPKPNSLSENS